MSRPRHSWYTVVLKVLRNYPELYKRHRQTQEQRVTPGYSGMPGGGGTSRKTENTAMKGLSPREEDDLEAVLTTIRTVGRWRDGETALRVVELVDWSQTHTIRGAEEELHLGEDVGKKLRRRVIDELAKNMRYK